MCVMSQIDSTKKVYVIVHGQRNLVEPVKEKLAAAGFKNTEMASLDKAGNAGEYVAMLWPPMAASEIMVSVITGPAEPGKSQGMGAWGSVATKEVMRLPLKK
jgi:hypothetical protein